MDLKSILKNGKKLLAAAQYEEAYTVLKEAIDEKEKDDYLLCCLFALAASNVEKIEEAVEMYEKAIEVDRKNVIAWQGLNKMYSTGKIEVDDRALETVEILLKESEESKREALMKDKRRFLIALRKFSSLTKEDIIEEKESIPIILNSLITEEKELTKEEENTCQWCFSILGEDSLTSETALLKALFFFKSSGYSSWSNLVYDNRINKENEWIKEKRRMAMSIYYMINGEMNDEWRERIDQDNEDIVFRLDDGDICASEIISASKDICLSIASLRLLIKDEEYEVAIKRIQSLETKFIHDSEIVSFLLALKAESLLRSGDYKSALKLIPLPRPSFGLIEARILIENGKELDHTLMSTLDEYEKCRIEVRKLLKENKKEEAESRCSELDGEEWEDTLLWAECSAPSKAMTLLVKTAKMNSRCSRSFYLLATILRGKNRAKAISLTERAASIRRGNEEYAKLLDDIMCENGEEDAKRLKCMQRFIDEASPIPEWARISISRLLLNSNRVNDAMMYLQDGIGDADCAIRWALLGEAYSLRGQLSSSINAYEESLKRKRDLHIVVSMLEVSLRLDFSRTITLCNEWMEEAKDSSALTPILLILSQATLAICIDDISTHLPSLFIHLNKLFLIAPPSSVLYKLFGDSLFLLSKSSSSIFSTVVTPAEWKIKDNVSCMRAASLFYSGCVNMKKDECSFWSDLALSLYSLWKMEGTAETLERARKCIVQSIQLSGGKRKSSRSKLWSYLAMIEEGRGMTHDKIKHCLSRSIQLDGKNDEAWLRLGVLLWKEGEKKAACQAIENSTTWGINQSEAWSIWGEMAWNADETEKGTKDGEDLFRHSISLNPTVWAVRRYTQIVCNRLAKGEKWSPAKQLIDMKRVTQLKYFSFLSTEEDRLRLAILAELCGCYEEAREFHESLGESVHKTRNELKYSCIASTSASPPKQNDLIPIYKLCKESTERLRDLVESCGYVLDPSVKNIEKDGEGDEKRVIKTTYPSIHPDKIPLLISFIITFGQDLEDTFVSTLHDLSPRDELIDFFPTVIPEEVDNGLRFIAKDGEEPYRIQSETSRELLAILKKRRLLLKIS